MSTIVTRAGKGSALTHNEVDANFTNLNTDKVEKTGTDPVVISVNSASDALRITQTGTGNALVVEDSANPDSTPFVVNANGQVITGNTTAVAFTYASAPRIEVIGTSQSTSSIAATTFNGTAGVASAMLLGRGRGTAAAPTIVSSGDDIGLIQFESHDGTALIPAASILAEVDGTPGTNDMPGRLVLSTTADGASSPTERMRIDSSGNVAIGTSSPSSYGKFASIGTSGTNQAFIGVANEGWAFNTFSSGTAYLTYSAATVNTAAFGSASNIPLAFLTNNTERARIATNGDFSFNSGYGSVATAYGCRAWVNFNGTGTVAIRASGNVSSITDNGTGNYTVNFTTAMPDANYAATVGGCYTDNNSPERNFGAVTEQFTTTSLKLFTTDMTSGSALDMAIISCSIFR